MDKPGGSCSYLSRMPHWSSAIINMNSHRRLKHQVPVDVRHRVICVLRSRKPALQNPLGATPRSDRSPQIRTSRRSTVSPPSCAISEQSASRIDHTMLPNHEPDKGAARRQIYCDVSACIPTGLGAKSTSQLRAGMERIKLPAQDQRSRVGPVPLWTSSRDDGTCSSPVYEVGHIMEGVRRVGQTMMGKFSFGKMGT
jgi:hypothetical protein